MVISPEIRRDRKNNRWYQIFARINTGINSPVLIDISGVFHVFQRA
jgi:hypothetical protein